MRPMGKGTYNHPAGNVIILPCINPPNLVQMFVMTKEGVIMTDESVCLDAPEKDTQHIKPKVKIMMCNGLERQKWEYNEEVIILKLFYFLFIFCITDIKTTFSFFSPVFY